MDEGLASQMRGAREPVAARANPWPLASCVALALCCAVDLSVPPRPAASAAFLGFLAALLLPLGLLHGAVWASAFGLLRRAPPWLARGVWLVAGAASALWLAERLGAFTRLHSRYWQLAVAVLLGSAAAGLSVGALCAALQPTAARPQGALLGRGPLTRWLAALVLAVGFVGLQIADRRLFPNQYLIAHIALRAAALWCAMFACALALRGLPRATWAVWAVAAAAYLTCLFVLDGAQIAVLNSFDARPWPTAVLNVSRRLVDFDRDGHAAFLGDNDCDPWNPRVHPGARDIPDNGIDENCILGDASGRRNHSELVPPAHDPPPLDVVLITVDAFNPLHLGVYNPESYGPKGRNTSPNLDRWAKDATVFEHAYSPGGWTSIAVPSLLRGVYPRRLKWRRYYETNLNAMVDSRALGHLRAGEQAMHMFPLAFQDPHPSIAEMMRRRGLATYAVTDDGISSMLQRGTGIERGFDAYRQVDALPIEQRDDAGTADYAIKMLSGVAEDKRFFMWVHFFGTHYPDSHHPGTREYGTRPTDLYDHEVAFLDSQLIRLLDVIAQRKHPVAVLISADHSEGLNAVTRYHGDSLDEPVIRIPLIVRVPGWPAKRVSQVASSIDLVPTILGLLKSPIPRYLDGIDLATTLDQHVKPRVLFSDTWRYDPASRVIGDYSAAYDGTLKYVLDRRSGGLYAASQTEPRVTEHLIGMAPTDGLSSAVYAYVEESGILQLAN
ncbi:MAG: sulfatase-like hydrolase/transferase [Polyangiales bacterium]